MKQIITFPQFTGIRCLMMPFIQGDPESVPKEFRKGYEEILETVFIEKGDIGFLTIDESVATQGKPHRGARAKYGRALHTEAGRNPQKIYCWGGRPWGGSENTFLERDVKILLANNLDDSCAFWDVEHEDTSLDGDIGFVADKYPYETATIVKAGEVHEIGILTPHESLPVKETVNRQFLRIISSGVHGSEEYFTKNPLLH